MAKHVDAAKCDDWRGRLAKFDASGLTVAEFCRREQVSQARFYYWSKRIRRRGHSQTAPTRPSGVGSATSRAEDETGAVEVLVGNSIRVRMPCGEPAAVAALVRHLQDLPQAVDTSAQASRFQRIELTQRPPAQR